MYLSNSFWGALILNVSTVDEYVTSFGEAKIVFLIQIWSIALDLKWFFIECFSGNMLNAYFHP